MTRILIAPLSARRSRAARLLAACLLGSALFLLAAPSATLADSAKVTKARGTKIKVKIRAGRGEVCSLTVRRGEREKRIKVRMGKRRSRTVTVRIRGRSRARATVRCKGKQRPSTGTTRVALSPYDIVFVEQPGDTIYIYKGVGLRSLQLMYSFDVEGFSLFWERVYVGGKPYDGLGDNGAMPGARPFSGDFSKLLFYGQPQGTDTRQIAEYDLVNGAVTSNLTAPRQGEVFSAPVLCEDFPQYQFHFSPRAGHSSDAVEFFQGFGPMEPLDVQCSDDRWITTVTNPAAASASPRPDERLGYATPNADGTLLNGTPPASLYPNEEGSGFFAADGSLFASDSECGDYLLGWVDTRTVINAVGDAPEDWRAATLQPDGTVTCSGGIPSTGKTISDVSLSFDRKWILFSVAEASGQTTYRQPITGGEPTLASYPEAPDIQRYDSYQVGPAIP